MFLRRLTQLVVMVGLLLSMTSRGSSDDRIQAVDLVDFRATYQSGQILIEWETATEIDNAGFFVTRNTHPYPPFTEISGFIPAEGSGVIGARYEFVDTMDIEEGVTYFYVLEIIDTSNHIDYSDIVSVFAGDLKIYYLT